MEWTWRPRPWKAGGEGGWACDREEDGREFAASAHHLEAALLVPGQRYFRTENQRARCPPLLAIDGTAQREMLLMVWPSFFRRRRLLREPIPMRWYRWMDTYRSDVSAMPADLREAVLRRAYVIAEEKYWEGCGGMQLTDEHRAAIALQAGRIAACFENEYFQEIRSILVYPDAYVARNQHPIGSGLYIEQDTPRSGEAWYRGPVIIAWRELATSLRHPWPPRNVVIHEFAHLLDMRNGGQADGIPLIASPEFAEHWLGTMRSNRQTLEQECESGYSDVLDCYAATSLAEFFAVASESYFESPHALRESWPAVFDTLNRFYRAHPLLV